MTLTFKDPNGVKCTLLAEYASDDGSCASHRMPTIADILGVKLPDDRAYDGVSLLPLIQQKTRTRPQGIGFHFKGVSTWHAGPWKLTVTGDTTTLYNLVADPGEKKNMAAEIPNLTDELTAAMQAWRESCDRDPESIKR